MNANLTPGGRAALTCGSLAMVLALSLQPAAFAQPQAGSNTAYNSMAAAIVQDHIFLRPGETILVRMGYSGLRLVPRFVAEGEEATEGDPWRNQVRLTFLPDGGPPVLRVENNSDSRLHFTATYRDKVGNKVVPETCPAYRGVTDLHTPPRAIRVEIQDFSWGGHVRSGQEC